MANQSVHQEILKNPLYKIRLCNFNKKGRCLRGPVCRFAHGVAELRGPMLQKQKGPKASDSKNKPHHQHQQQQEQQHQQQQQQPAALNGQMENTQNQPTPRTAKSPLSTDRAAYCPNTESTATKPAKRKGKKSLSQNMMHQASATFMPAGPGAFPSVFRMPPSFPVIILPPAYATKMQMQMQPSWPPDMSLNPFLHQGVEAAYLTPLYLPDHNRLLPQYIYAHSNATLLNNDAAVMKTTELLNQRLVHQGATLDRRSTSDCSFNVMDPHTRTHNAAVAADGYTYNTAGEREACMQNPAIDVFDTHKTLADFSDIFSSVPRYEYKAGDGEKDKDTYSPSFVDTSASSTELGSIPDADSLCSHGVPNLSSVGSREFMDTSGYAEISDMLAKIGLDSFDNNSLFGAYTGVEFDNAHIAASVSLGG